MKTFTFCLIIFVVELFLSVNLFAQSLDHLTLIAHYPLISTANDATGRYGPMELTNTPFQDGGIYCNGIYEDGVQSNACDARTPVLDALSFHSLAVSAEFKIGDYPEVRMPVIVSDPIGFRWLYVFVDQDSTIGFGSAGDFDQAPSTDIKLNLQQWYTVTVTWDSVSSQMMLYLNSAAVDSSVLTLEYDNSRRVGISHGGVGKTFMGWLRNLKIYSYATTTQVGADESVTPGRFVLSQNYPNPFNPTTTIGFAVKQAGHVLLTIYDSRGREIMRLIDEDFQPGEYRQILDAYNWPSGVYFYRMHINDYKAVRKMILLR